MRRSGNFPLALKVAIWMVLVLTVVVSTQSWSVEDQNARWENHGHYCNGLGADRCLEWTEWGQPTGIFCCDYAVNARDFSDCYRLQDPESHLPF